MINTGKLAGKTVYITAANRGIGKAIALKVAKDGANVVVSARSAKPHPKIPGTLLSAAEEIEHCGGRALPCIVDVREESQIRSSMEEAVKKFGGIDLVINNASAMELIGSEALNMQQYDLMQDTNTRGTFMVSKLALPYLKKSKHAHILNLSPPLNLQPRFFSPHLAFTISKYGMSMCAKGMAEEFKPFNIAVNTLWPKTVIQTAALHKLGRAEGKKYERIPEVMSDAAYAILIQDPNSPESSGKFHIDEDVLKANGITDLDQYRMDPQFKGDLLLDLFIGNSIDVIKFMNKNLDHSLGESSGKIEDLFKKIQASLSEELVKSIGATLQFELTGKDEGKWFLDLKFGAGKCGKGDAPTKTDATLRMDSENFMKMFSGKMKPISAYMMGKLKISGNLQDSLKLEKLLKKL